MSIPVQAGQAPAVERQLVADMARRSLPWLPVVAVVAGLLRGVDGAVSALFAVAVILANLALSAGLATTAARIAPVVLGAAAMGGFVVRLGLVMAVVLAVRNQPWVDMVTLAVTLAVAHLGLLAMEARYVSATLAFPGIKPKRQNVDPRAPVRLESVGQDVAREEMAREEMGREEMGPMDGTRVKLSDPGGDEMGRTDRDDRGDQMIQGDRTQP
ncbi:MAG: hypothetical protein ACT4OS_10960 [Acidimicrobiales bacterium]